jgi:hypothetical protein
MGNRMVVMNAAIAAIAIGAIVVGAFYLGRYERKRQRGRGDSFLVTVEAGTVFGTPAESPDYFMGGGDAGNAGDTKYGGGSGGASRRPSASVFRPIGAERIGFEWKPSPNADAEHIVTIGGDGSAGTSGGGGKA